MDDYSGRQGEHTEFRFKMDDYDEWQGEGEGEGGDVDEGVDEGEGDDMDCVLSHDEVRKMIGDSDPPEATKAALHHRVACLASYRVLPRVDPKSGPKVESVAGLDGRIVNFLKRCKITEFYDYQYRAISQILDRKSVVIEAPTAFGKTEAFLVPIAQLASTMTRGSVLALFVYPTKALGRDQLPKIASMAGVLGMRVAIFDGDTMKDERNSLVRDTPEFLVTNFDTMHKQMFMHNQLAGMLPTVKFLVVDEAHYYSGVFGANAHHIISRLKRLTGAIQCVGASATLSNSGEFCSALFGQEVGVIKEAGRRSKVDMAIMAPPKNIPKRRLMVNLAKILVSHDREARLGATPAGAGRLGIHHAAPEGSAGRREAGGKTVELAQDIARPDDAATPQKKKVMVFSNTHRSVELAGREAKLDGLRAEVHRGGLDKDYLEAIEGAFRGGGLDMLFCTPTMELGMDIGNVDGVISESVPANRFMQRIGRAGRGGERGCAFLVLGRDPISRYYLDHPDEFMRDKWIPHIDTANPDVEDMHTVAAALDHPLEREEIKSRMKSILRCRAENMMERADVTWRATERGRERVKWHNVRGIERSVKIKLDGEVVGQRVLPMALSELHGGAIYMLGGRPHMVERLDYPRKKTATMTPMPYNSRERTKALGRTWATYTETIKSHMCLDTQVELCRLRVTQTINGYVHYTGAGAEYKSLDEQLRHFFGTKGIKFRAAAPTGVLASERPSRASQESSHAIAHLVANASRMIAGAAEQDVDGVLNDDGTICIYDNARGGNGIADILYGRMESVLRRAYDIVGSCPCKEASGCPRCTLSHRCSWNNAGLHKAGAVESLKKMLGNRAALHK